MTNEFKIGDLVQDNGKRGYTFSYLRPTGTIISIRDHEGSDKVEYRVMTDPESVPEESRERHHVRHLSGWHYKASELMLVQEEDSAVTHPSHYTQHPSGIECKTITSHMSFNLGNALKYIWRCDLKKDAIQDLEKAKEYIEIELKQRRA